MLELLLTATVFISLGYLLGTVIRRADFSSVTVQSGKSRRATETKDRELEDPARKPDPSNSKSAAEFYRDNFTKLR